MNQNIFQQIAAKHINEFVENLGEELRVAVSSMWNGGNAFATSTKKRGRPASKKPVAAKAKAKAKATKAPKVKNASKKTRGTVDMETLGNILTALNLSPEGVGAADIIDALKIPKPLWIKTIKYALAEGYARSEGKTRKTKYFAGKKSFKAPSASNGATTHEPVSAAAE
jgi:hypothetical protein